MGMMAMPMGPAGGVQISPGTSATVTASLRAAFRPERLIISSSSFQLSRLHRIRTWPAIKVGDGLTRLHRTLARALRVDLYAPHERRDRVTDQELAEIDQEEPDAENPSETIEELRYRHGFAIEYDEDDNEHWYRIVEIPLNRRERALAPLGRVARRLSGVRRTWQEAQASLLMVREIMIGDRSQLPQSGPLPADMFNVSAIDAYVSFESCAAGQEIRINIDNGSAYPCHLMMTMIGRTS
jgi:hypothetical protein